MRRLQALRPEVQSESCCTLDTLTEPCRAGCTYFDVVRWCVGGPPRFISPFIPGRSPRASLDDMPLMVYLPGIDGTGLAASRQFPYLADAFDLHALSIPSADRTPFEVLVNLTQ